MSQIMPGQGIFPRSQSPLLSLLIVTLIRRLARLPRGLSLETLSFWVILPSPGSPRSSLPSHDLQLRLNTYPWLSLVVNLNSYSSCYLICVFCMRLLSNYIVIVRQPCISLLTQYITSAPNILKWNVICTRWISGSLNISHLCSFTISISWHLQ